ncbi:Endo-1,4-beta-glucanase [Chitinispirillum alkaliphilum]|nr:Endo-1,4-beta-glucanase [Chitinispirillum alkaliphilum]
MNWSWATFENPAAASGTTDWTWYEGVPVSITDVTHVIGRPALQGNDIGEGTVWFDDITLVERDASGNETGQWSWDYNRNDDFYYWSDPQQGSGTWSATEGREGSGCWKITGSGRDAVLSDGLNMIMLKRGHSYTMSGWMKTENLPPAAQARIRLDFYSSDGELYKWNREYLEAELDRYLEFGRQHNVPLYLGEFGCITGAFEENRGGLIWVEQMLQLCEEKGIHYNYHTWHETAFGIYQNPPHLPFDPSTGNQELINLFTRMQRR